MENTNAIANILTRRLPAYLGDDLRAKVEKINRRAAKHGFTGFGLMFGEIANERVECTTANGEAYTRTIPMQTVSLIGPTIKMPGFRFLGKIDHSGETNLVMSAPGESVPVEYRTAGPDCDHCHTGRRRNDTFILVEAVTGQTRQIGRNCLADYLGHNPEMIIAQFDFMRRASNDMDGESENWGSDGFKRGAHPLDILAYSAAIMRRVGWTSKANASPETGKPATSELVITMMLSANVENRIRPEAVDYAAAEKALDWARGTLPKMRNLNDYQFTLAGVLAREFVETKLFGYAVSGMNAYNRVIEAAIARANERAGTAATPSTYVGVVNGKVNLANVLVARINTFNSTYGVTTVIAMIDDAGNNLVWFASKAPQCQRGDRVTVSGTVKCHKLNRDGQPETVLTRCNVVRNNG